MSIFFLSTLPPRFIAVKLYFIDFLLSVCVILTDDHDVWGSIPIITVGNECCGGHGHCNRKMIALFLSTCRILEQILTIKCGVVFGETSLLSPE